MSIPRKIYQVIGAVAAPLAWPFFILHNRGRRRIRERYGYWKGVPDGIVWLHGASLGEVQGIKPLIAALDCVPLLLSATSPTALEQEALTVPLKRLLPFDSAKCVRRALSTFTPKAFIFAETELWPTLLVELSARNVPIHLVNGRISDYTVSRYKLIRRLIAEVLSKISSYSVISEGDKERFVSLGAAADRIRVTGHMKYDTSPSVHSVDDRSALFELLCLDATNPVLVLGSIRPDEEQIWFSAIKRARTAGCKFSVIVAPRHAEKFEYFAKAMRSLGEFQRYSHGLVGEGDTILLDTFGMLERIYSIASVAFIGATLVNIGGHNPLEAAAYGAQVVVGPHIKNIREIVAEMRSCAGVRCITTEQCAFDILMEMVKNPEATRKVGVQGQSVWKAHRGATARVLEHLELNGFRK